MIRISCLHEVPIRSSHFPITVEGPAVCGVATGAGRDALARLSSKRADENSRMPSAKYRPRANDGRRCGSEYSNYADSQGSRNGRRGDRGPSHAVLAAWTSDSLPGGHRFGREAAEASPSTSTHADENTSNLQQGSLDGNAFPDAARSRYPSPFICSPSVPVQCRQNVGRRTEILRSPVVLTMEAKI